MLILKLLEDCDLVKKQLMIGQNLEEKALALIECSQNSMDIHNVTFICHFYFRFPFHIHHLNEKKKQLIISSSYHIVDYFDLLIPIARVRVTRKQPHSRSFAFYQNQDELIEFIYEPFEFAKLLLELAYVLLRLLSLV